MREDQKEKKETWDMIGRAGDGGLRERKTGRDSFGRIEFFLGGEKIKRKKKKGERRSSEGGGKKNDRGKNRKEKDELAHVWFLNI